MQDEDRNIAAERQRITNRAQIILHQLDDQTQGNLRLIAQGARAALDPKFQPLSTEAFTQSVVDVQKAAHALAQDEYSLAGESGTLAEAQLSWHMARQIGKLISEELQAPVRGRKPRGTHDRGAA